jgi:SAM-dependent methyltransferase
VPGRISATDREPVLVLDRREGEPFLGHNDLLISGRISSVGGAETVTVTIAGGSYEAAVLGSRFELALDTSAWPAGPKPFSVAVRASDGRSARAEGVADVWPYSAPPPDEAGLLGAVAAGRPAMWCEAPDLDGGAIEAEKAEVRGWAIAPEGIDRVLVTIDGRRRLPALLGLPRPDLRWGFGDELAAAAGFAVRLHPEELDGDSHLLTVVAVAADGSAQGMAGMIEVSRAASPRRAAEDSRVEPLPPQRLPRAADDDSTSDLALACERYGCYALVSSLGLTGRALDVGCESGWGTAILAERMEGAVGVEISPPAVEEAATRWAGAAEFLAADFTRLPFGDAEFDLVACFGGLDHVGDPRGALAEMRRTVRSDGVLAVAVGDGGATGPLLCRDPLGREPLAEWLAESFAHVSVLRPRWVFGGALDGAAGSTERIAGPAGALAAERRGWLALASDTPLPPPPDLVLLDAVGVEDERRLATEQWRERSVLAEVRMATLRTEVHYTTHALLETVEREQTRALGAEDELAAARSQLDLLSEERRALLESASWRTTRPLRNLAARLRAWRGRR